MTDETGETVPFANIEFQESGEGTTTDLDGAYSYKLEPGTYTVIFSTIGYSDYVVNDVAVEAGKVEILNVTMSTESEQLEEIVVTAEVVKTTEAALLTLQRKSPNLIDGISKQTFSRSGDGDAAEAIKRVTGVSVEGGKYVYVRGLGDRYTKTQLNGVDVPGLDPDRNTLQMDIFPTNLIDNIIVYKTFTPDLPSDFTGGMVNIVTKDFPERYTVGASVSFGFNPQMNLNEFYLDYEGGGTDILGFDDGTREIPIPQNTILNDFDPAVEPDAAARFVREFPKQMAVDTTTSFLNTSVAFSIGNQINKEKVTLGYNVALNYSNNYTYYGRQSNDPLLSLEDEDFQFPFYIKSSNQDQTELIADNIGFGRLGINNVLWSGLIGGNLKVKKSKFGLTVFRSQNGESTAGRFFRNDIRENPADLLEHNLTYTQRSVTNILLTGKHAFEESNMEIEWKLSPTFSTIDDPDIRRTMYEWTDLEPRTLELRESVGAGVLRTWRFLDEQNYGGRVDLTKEILLPNGRTTKIKAGIAETYKERTFDITSYFFIQRVTSPLTGNPDELFQEENLFGTENPDGIFGKGGPEPSNSYEGRQNIFGVYIMNEFPITDKLKTIYGVRVEKTDMWYTGQDANAQRIFEDSLVLDELNFLPSVNFVYELVENMNLRASYSRTLARPSFKEKSVAQIEDLITRRNFIGNIDLEQSNIDNFDIRWEYFFDRGQVVSVSGFYKFFDNPIEILSFDETSPNDFQPRNVQDAE